MAKPRWVDVQDERKNCLVHRRHSKASSDLKVETEVPAEPGGGGTSHRHDVVSVTRLCASSFLSCADGARGNES